MKKDSHPTHHHSIPRSFIDDLLARIDIVEVIDKRVPLRKQGANFVARCPFHDEKTPSFSVSPAKQFYYCFGCGAHGNAIGFLMQHEKMHFIEAVKTLASSLGLVLPHEVDDEKSREASSERNRLLDFMARAESFYRWKLQQSSRAQKYLESRGLSQKMCERFMLGYAPGVPNELVSQIKASQDDFSLLVACGLLKSDKGRYYERFRDRIIFPIRNQRGSVIGFGGRSIGGELPKYLNSPETPLFHKGDEIYGLYEARLQQKTIDMLLVVEGYMDVIALAQHGIGFAVASMGTAITTLQVQKLLRNSQRITFCFDGDLAGRGAAWRALEIILPLLSCGIEARFLFLPDQEDPDSLIRKEGSKAFLQRLETALYCSDFLFKSLSAQVDLGTLEGRAGLAQRAGRLLRLVQDGVFLELLLQKLARLVRLDVDKLKASIFAKEDASPVFFLPQKSLDKSTSLPQIISHAISLLLSCPELVSITPELDDLSSVPEELQFRELQACDSLSEQGVRLQQQEEGAFSSFDHYQKSIVDEKISCNKLIFNEKIAEGLPGISLFFWLIGLLRKEPSLTAGAILQYCRDAESARMLSELAARAPIIPRDDLKREFAGTIKGLHRYIVEKEIEVLLTKAAKEGLLVEEKKYLQGLICKSKLL